MGIQRGKVKKRKKMKKKSKTHFFLALLRVQWGEGGLNYNLEKSEGKNGKNAFTSVYLANKNERSVLISHRRERN